MQSISRRNVLRLLAGASAATLAPVTSAMETPLKTLAAEKGLRFGNALGYPHRTPDYLALMARECNTIVPENATKWKALQPRPDQFAFEQADQIYAWAREQHMHMRGHTLLWQDQRWFPEWVKQHDFGATPIKEAERLLHQHISQVCQHFGDSIYSWDVVNEAVAPATGKLISNVFADRLGTLDQLDLCFRLAREHAPRAQLVYNDYMDWGQGSATHRAGVLTLLQQLKKRGTPVQALGIQSHISYRQDPGKVVADLREWRKFLDEVTGMGLDLLITEFDVNDKRLPADVAQRDAGVAAVARDYLDATLSYPQLRDFLLWGMADNISWLQSWESSKRSDGLAQRPTPFDAQLNGKPLRAAIAGALRSMPPRT
jgi:endo-1,4-beta-xylanase